MKGAPMSQKTVEQIIGRLATDERARIRFRRGPRSAIHELAPQHKCLSPVEADALCSLDLALFEWIANTLDPRLQRVSIRTDDRAGAPVQSLWRWISSPRSFRRSGV